MTLHKIVLVGDKNTGKTCLVKALRGDIATAQFPVYFPTVAVEFSTHDLMMDDSRCLLHLWDTAGQSHFRTITSRFLSVVNAFVLVYSVADESSFSNLPYWFDHIQEHGSQSEASPKIIIGCKCDLEEERQVSYEMAKDFADDRGVLLLEVSSKDGTNVERAFMTLYSLLCTSNS